MLYIWIVNGIVLYAPISSQGKALVFEISTYCGFLIANNL